MSGLVAFAALLTGSVGVAWGSIVIATGPVHPALRVDGAGNAEVSWSERGARTTVIVPARGQLYHGGSLPGADVSKPAHVAGLPFARVVRKTPDGRLWALQQWTTKPGGPLELHLARWRGTRTKLSLAIDGDALTGRASFHGRPVTGRSSTLEGKHPRIYVYLDRLAGGAWKPMLGVAPRGDGTFRVLIRPQWKSACYRATLLGPNIGSTFAPDTRAIVC